MLTFVFMPLFSGSETAPDYLTGVMCLLKKEKKISNVYSDLILGLPLLSFFLQSIFLKFNHPCLPFLSKGYW